MKTLERQRRRPNVYVMASIPARIQAALEQDFDLSATPEDVDGILSVIPATVDSELLERCGPKLRVVANYGVGVDNVDLDAARERDIAVTNTPDVLTHATAELAITLMLSVLRRVPEGDRMIRRREPWSVSLEFMLGTSLDGRRLLIVGPGRIGRETARLADALGAKILMAGRQDPLRDTIAQADVVSLHCPLTAQTHHLIDDETLCAMQSHAILVNTARGPIVDEQALVRALGNGVIAGAALDVFEFEPQVADELLSMENVVLTPHLGSATRSTREAMGMLAVDALRAVLIDGRKPINSVV